MINYVAIVGAADVSTLNVYTSINLLKNANVQARNLRTVGQIKLTYDEAVKIVKTSPSTVMVAISKSGGYSLEYIQRHADELGVMPHVVMTMWLDDSAITSIRENLYPDGIIPEDNGDDTGIDPGQSGKEEPPESPRSISEIHNLSWYTEEMLKEWLDAHPHVSNYPMIKMSVPSQSNRMFRYIVIMEPSTDRHFIIYKPEPNASVLISEHIKTGPITSKQIDMKMIHLADFVRSRCDGNR